MALEIVGSNPITHPTLFCNTQFFELRDFTIYALGCRLAVKATDFDSVIAGSNPAIPAILFYDPLAQLAEHLTFNQGVRSSNLRWIRNAPVTMWRGLRE